MLAVLRQRNFALVWFGGLISLTGDWLLFVALPLFVYQLTGSTLATAALVASRVVPRLALGSVAGVFVDRWDRRRTMILSNLLLGGCLLPLLVVRTAEWLWVVYLVSFVQSVLVQFLEPSENALLPLLVDQEQLVPANALNGLTNNLARLIGPPIGGFVVAAWGLVGTALLDTGSFLVAAGLVALVAADGRAVRADGSGEATESDEPGGAGAFAAMWREWVAGLALVRRVRTIAILFVYIAITMVGEGAMSTLFVPFVTRVLGGDGPAYGAVLAAQAVGGLLGYAIIGHVGRGMPPGRLLGLGAIGLGAIDLLIFNAYRVAPGLVAPLILMAVVGLPAAGIGVGYNTLLQTAVADEYRGRVFGAFGATSALGLLVGSSLAGVLGELLGIVTVLNLQGCAYLLAGALVLALLTRTRMARVSQEGAEG
jgi:MFS family permease